VQKAHTHTAYKRTFLLFQVSAIILTDGTSMTWLESEIYIFYKRTEPEFFMRNFSVLHKLCSSCGKININKRFENNFFEEYSLQAFLKNSIR